MKDVRRIKFLFQNAPSTVLLFVTASFSMSLAYNFSYFDHIGNLKYLSLLSFNDYVEGSLLNVILILIAGLYSQIIHLTPDGIRGIIREAGSNTKDLHKKIQEIGNRWIRYACYPLIDLVIIVIFLIKVVAEALPYLIVTLFSFAAYLEVIEDGVLKPEPFYRTLTAIPLLCFLIDLYLAKFDKKYNVRKLLLKICLVALALSFSLGAFHAARDFGKLSKSNSELTFLWAVNRGVFYKTEDNGLTFLPWDQIKKIDN